MTEIHKKILKTYGILSGYLIFWMAMQAERLGIRKRALNSIGIDFLNLKF